MKKTVNILAFLLVVVGLVLKANSYSGATIAINLAGVALIASMLLFGIKDNKEAGISDGLNYFLVGALVLITFGKLCNENEIPGRGMITILVYLVFLALPLVLIVQKKEFTVSGQFVFSVFLFLLLLLGTLKGNPLPHYFGNTESSAAK